MKSVEGIWRHFKTGNYYQVEMVGRNSETLEEMVVYYLTGDKNRKTVPSDGYWIRPLSMWTEMVVSPTTGKMVQRFERDFK